MTIPMLETAGLTFREVWARRVALSPDRTFLVTDDRSWTYAEFEQDMSRVAGALAELGVGVGTRVLVGLDNRAEAVLLHIALARLGAVCVPLQSGLTFEELRYQIEHSESELLVAGAPLTDTVLPRLGELPALRRLVLDTPGTAPLPVPVTGLRTLLDGDPLPFADLPGYDVDSPAMILYTSGSTGRPKGVVLSSGSFGSAGAAFAERFGVTAEDNYFLPLTLAHAIGALTAQSMTVVTGSALTLVPRFSPSVFWEQVHKSGATYSILFPAHLNLLLSATPEADRADIRSTTPLRLVITHATNGPFQENFGVELAMVWGMTETGALSTGSAPGETAEGEGYVGHAMRGVDIGIFDDRGQPLPPGQVGEIRLRHRHIMLGYLKDPEATAATVVDGWVRSGDQGVLDEQGRLFFKGRQKNMIKRSGENISPEEIENVLLADPRIAECLVFGVPDPIRSEEVAAVIVLRSEATVEELAETAAEKLVRWKIPRFVRLSREPLPRLGNGKIDRVSVRNSFDSSVFVDRAASGR